MSKKDYKQGAADAMAAYEAFGEKQEAAIRHIGNQVEEVKSSIGGLNQNIQNISGYITDKEKAELYKLNTPVDIADLDDAEKRILLAVLYQLSTDDPEHTPQQENYVRAVQKYLEIHNPQTQIDLEAVENIEDISAQKAVLQTALEYFYLGTHPGTYDDNQLDFLDCFQVNRKTRREIIGHINQIVETVGIEGLAEKYGFVVANEEYHLANYQDNGAIPEDVADLCIRRLHEGAASPLDNGRYFVETADYIVYCYSKKCTEADDNIGFWWIHKGTGKEGKIDYDISSVFTAIIGGFIRAFNITYCVQKNTVYFTENHTDRDSIQILEVNFDTKSARLLKPTFLVNQHRLNQVHLSIYNNLLVVFLHGIPVGAAKPLPSQTYIVDLAQNDRTFTIEPTLGKLGKIYDVFICGGNILLLGTEYDNHSCIPLGQLYKYDFATKKYSEFTNYSEKNFNLISISEFSTIEGLTQYNDKYIVQLLNKSKYGWEEPSISTHVLSDDPDDCGVFGGGCSSTIIDDTLYCYGTSRIVEHSLKDGNNLYWDNLPPCKYTVLLGDYVYRIGDDRKTYKTNLKSDHIWELLSF